MMPFLKNRHVLSLTGNGVMAVLSLFTYLILYRFLAAADMGNWIFFQFVFLLLDTFRTGLLQTALIKFYAGTDENRKRNVAGAAWFLALLITGALVLLNGAALPFAHWATDAGVRVALQWFGLSLAVTLPYNVALWLLQAEQRFDRILLIRLLSQGSFIVLVVGLYLLHAVNLQGVINAFLLSSLLTSVVALVAGWAHLRDLRHRTAAEVRALFHFGKYSFGTFLCANLFRSSDAFIVKFMLGPAALAIYNLPTRLLEIIEIPLRSGLATAMPSMSAAVNQRRETEVAAILKKYTVLLTLLFVPLIIGTLLLADVIVGLIGGGKYVGTEAANIYRIMMVCSLLFPLERFLGVTLDIINKPQLNLVKVVLGLTVNVVADIICIKLLGNVYGAALASVFTLITSTVFGYVALRRYLPITFRGAFDVAAQELKSSTAGLFHKVKLLRL